MAAPFGAVGNTNVGQSVCRLLIDTVDSFTYAAWQNSVPVLRSIEIDNTGRPELSNLKLVLHASVPFVRDRTWVIDRIGAEEKLSIPLADLSIAPEYLNHLEEAERAILTFRLVHRETVIQESEQPIRVLARDEWGGLASMGELLPAFVTPNDPALAVLLRSAATLLGQHGHSTALDGYLSGSSDRVYMLAASLWSAIASYRLIYAVPPASFEQTGQKTRRIKTILNDRLATCLDTSLLFASGLEAMGLNPVLVLTQGHCFVGAWLVKKMFARLVERDCVEIRKAIAAKELIVFETTLVTQHPPARFPDAISTANSALSEGKEREFAAVIDVARGRMCYGLGSENQNLPGFVVLCPGKPVVGPQLWSNSFLPGIFQGCHINNSKLDPKEVIRNISNNHLSRDAQRRQLDMINQMNGLHRDERGGDPQLEARIQSMEMAFRMQTEAQEAFDLNQESKATRELYGAGQFADACLVARRLAERGVRMTQVYYGGGQPWDDHGNIADHASKAKDCDKPIAALIRDLKSRGLFEETLILWGGEFGRTPTSEGSKGRDHNNHGFSVWLAGGGIKGGLAYGSTDEFGFAAVEKRTHVHDLHATMLHLLGIDHTRLTYRYSGRDYRLTDVHGEVVRDILA